MLESAGDTLKSCYQLKLLSVLLPLLFSAFRPCSAPQPHSLSNALFSPCVFISSQIVSTASVTVSIIDSSSVYSSTLAVNKCLVDTVLTVNSNKLLRV